MKSMTGIGKANGQVLGIPVRVEIKTVNHRYCEISFRAHGKYSALEIPVQQLVKEIIGRGHVDIFIFEEKQSQISETDLKAFVAYNDYLKGIIQKLHLQDTITLDHLLTGASSWIQKEIDPKQAWQDLEPILRMALNDLDEMRQSEGQRLQKDFVDRFNTIHQIRDMIQDEAKKIHSELEKKLQEKITAKLAEVKELDPQRLHTEVVYYADRMDITEELERLKSHMTLSQTFLNSKEAMGRKMDFLLQEYNREFNTIASKSQSAHIAHLVVDAKAELEKIREQVQNIE